MEIKLQIDFDGNPFLVLKSDEEETVTDQLLEVFIKKGIRNGVRIINNGEESRADYASIILKRVNI